jgi:hypothetical protein
MTEPSLVGAGWQIEGIRGSERFFLSLHQLLPDPAYLVFEGVSIASDVRELLQASAVPARRQVAVGTLWPEPSTFHVPSSASFLAALAELAAQHAEPEMCDHFHAYDESRGLLQWYDAFDLPLLVSGSIEEARISSFCAALGATYKQWKAERRAKHT